MLQNTGPTQSVGCRKICSCFMVAADRVNLAFVPLLFPFLAAWLVGLDPLGNELRTKMISYIHSQINMIMRKGFLVGSKCDYLII